VIAFILLLSFVGFLSLNVSNKITDGNPLQTKLGIFIDEQEATSVGESVEWATAHESLRTTALS